VFGTLKAQLNN